MIGTRLRPYELIRGILSFRFEILDNDAPSAVRQKIERGTARLLRKSEPHLEMAHLIGHLAGFDLGDSPHVAGLLGEPQQLTSRARQLFIRSFVRLRAVQPSLMALEDVHNADDASLDLLGDVINEQPRQPLLLVCLARPDLVERRPAWGSGQLRESLSEDEIERGPAAGRALDFDFTVGELLGRSPWASPERHVT